ncbi:MAG: diguanylate cyclase/phosphodiesterase [Clostridia bacterium]|nr:diguanylate cyclase/phosphodiesterase [Clostridia bacterium]
MRSKHKIVSLFCLLFIMATMFYNAEVLKIYADETSHNVLILNSYHRGLSWTDKQTEGIIDVLEEYDHDCNIFVEYMDWKNHPTEENLKNIYQNLKYKFADKKIDVVITTDDAALDFALENREEIFSSAPIIFSGVNEGGIKKLTQGYSSFTGITEIVNPEKTVAGALQLKPDLQEIYVLFDNSESGISTGEITIQAIRNIDSSIKIHTLNDKSIKDLLQQVSLASDNSIILITTYYMDFYGTAIGFEDFSRLVSQSSKVPVFHLYDFGLNNGAIGGCLLNGKLQGESAAEMAVRVMEGEDINQIPLQSTINTDCMFDYQLVEKFDIPLDRIPEDSIIINKPFSFFEAYRSLVVTAIIIFCLLVVFIIVLATYLRKISRMNDELQKNHEELVASDNKLRQQFNELTKTQQKLISSEMRYSMLFEKMMNAFCVIEPVMNDRGKIVDIRFVVVNPGFRAQMGVDTMEIEGKTWMEVNKYPNKNLKIYHDILCTGAARHFDTYYPSVNVYYSANAFKISEHQIGVVFNNITEYKQAIKEITILNEELEQRVIERTEELQSAVNELEAFTHTVSHDLKSPLRAVDGYSRILWEDFEAKLGEEGVEIINYIRHICTDMIEMINKLLKYSTTTKADIVKEEVNIEEQFKSIYKEIKSAHSDRHIILTIETGLPVVHADRIMLRQVIYNVLSNAVKFTQNKEKAIITVGCTITGAEYIFYIKDNGAGFDMDSSGKLFGMFQRLHANDEFEGTGIGLVTVKKIIQRHGGRVWIEGKTDAGATVYFTLPFSQ